MSDEASSIIHASRPRNVPDTRSPRESATGHAIDYACSQPDRSSLNDNWFVRDLSRSVVSLSFRNLYLDDERTIFLQQDVEDKDSEPRRMKNGAAQNPDKNARESTKNECEGGDNHRGAVPEEDLLMIEQPLTELAEPSPQCTAEMREFYAQEMSEYVLIDGSSSSDDKVDVHSEMCDSNHKHKLIIDDDSLSSIGELTGATTGSPSITSRASVDLSTMNSSSTSSVNDMESSRRSRLDASSNSYASQSSSITGIILLHVNCIGQAY